MIVELLRSHAGEPQSLQPCTSFLVDRRVAIDAGCLGHSLSPARQSSIERVVLTHTHADHVASLPIFIAEVFPALRAPFEVHATRETLDVLRRHVFNGSIWPDFETIPLKGSAEPSMRFMPLEARRRTRVGHLWVTAIPVNHTVPTVGLLVDDGQSAVAFTADTYSTSELWEAARSLRHLKCVYADVSYSSDQDELARTALHHTPASLLADLEHLSRPDVQVLAVHLKPSFRERIVAEIDALGRQDLGVAAIGREYTW